MRSILAGLLLLLVAGCAAPAPTSTPIAVVPSPRPSPIPPTAPPTTRPSPSPRACLAQPGRMVTDEIQAEGMARSLPYRVYLPPCFEAGSGYPVLILIHGLQSTDSQWDDLGVDEVADALIQDGDLPPVVIVMPWERKGLDFEAAIVDVLLPFVESTYAGGLGREATAIGGLSRGAGWALRIGLQHPDLFGSIGLHSPAVLPPDMYDLEDWIRTAQQNSIMPRLWIDVAERDTSRAGAQELGALLDDLEVRYAWSSAPGEHSAPYWSSRLPDYLGWYGEAWLFPATTATP